MPEGRVINPVTPVLAGGTMERTGYHRAARNSTVHDATTTSKPATLHSHMDQGLGMQHGARNESVDGKYKWLLVVNVACADRITASMVDDMVEQFASPRFDFMVNMFDTLNASCLRSLQHPRLRRHVTIHHEPAFKPLYWKRFVTPEATRHYDLIILTDGDVRFDAHLGFTLAEVEFWLRRTRAAMLQPTVVAAARNLRAGAHGFAPKSFTADCAAVAVDGVERVYIARQQACVAATRSRTRLLRHGDVSTRGGTRASVHRVVCRVHSARRATRPGHQARNVFRAGTRRYGGRSRRSRTSTFRGPTRGWRCCGASWWQLHALRDRLASGPTPWLQCTLTRG